jgi:hypothetical protein
LWDFYGWGIYHATSAIFVEQNDDEWDFTGHIGQTVVPPAIFAVMSPIQNDSNEAKPL